eukprot:scaffold1894_cov153-Pinguiococcus_pyrenoidosus.AAC.2
MPCRIQFCHVDVVELLHTSRVTDLTPLEVLHRASSEDLVALVASLSLWSKSESSRWTGTEVQVIIREAGLVEPGELCRAATQLNGRVEKQRCDFGSTIGTKEVRSRILTGLAT